VVVEMAIKTPTTLTTVLMQPQQEEVEGLNHIQNWVNGIYAITV
jgi:hypothetical protein